MPVCHFVKKTQLSSQKANKYHKVTLKYPRKIAKSLPEYPLLQSYSGFIVSINIQNTSDIFLTEHLILPVVRPLSIEQLVFSAWVVLKTHLRIAFVQSSSQ